MVKLVGDWDAKERAVASRVGTGGTRTMEGVVWCQRLVIFFGKRPSRGVHTPQGAHAGPTGDPSLAPATPRHGRAHPPRAEAGMPSAFAKNGAPKRVPAIGM